jgi:hypothetical protein
LKVNDPEVKALFKPFMVQGKKPDAAGSPSGKGGGHGDGDESSITILKCEKIAYYYSIILQCKEISNIFEEEATQHHCI